MMTLEHYTSWWCFVVRKHTKSGVTFQYVTWSYILYESCISQLALFVAYNACEETLNMPTNSFNYKRTNLFLLRVWCEDDDANANGEKGEGGEGSGLKWHGRLQGTVSGESHSFDGKDTLIEVLESLLYKERQERTGHTGPPVNAGSAGNISSGGNKPNEANR